MSHTATVTYRQTYEMGGALGAREALNQRRTRLREQKIPHTVDHLTLKFIDPSLGEVTIEYRDGQP